MARTPYLDPDLPVEQRVQDLVGRMTLEEKVSQMVYESRAIPRLGIPEYNWWNEGLHGVGRAGIATVFPQAIGLAAAFDLSLLGRIAVAVSDEARAKHHVRAPGVPQAVPGPDALEPEREHFPRPPVGTGPGDVRGKTRISAAAWGWPSSKESRAMTSAA